MMPEWKLNIFINAITYRMEVEQWGTEEIIAEYVLLTEEEKTEILNNIGGEIIGD